jgi:pseudouridine synthase
MMRLCDLAAMRDIAHGAGALLMVDNTFASPFNQRPLTLGADVAYHSSTKYLGGHSDVVNGVIATNDGALAERLMHPRYEVEKVYVARVGPPDVRPEALRALRDGVELEDGLAAPAEVRALGEGRYELTIHEGRKRQVRRMFEALGHGVIELERVAFGPLRLEGLPPGESRRLSDQEIELLHRHRSR